HKTGDSRDSGHDPGTPEQPSGEQAHDPEAPAPDDPAAGMTPETEGWAHPLHAPLYFPRVGQNTPWHKSLTVSFRADPTVLARFVPEPLQLVGDEVAAVVTEHYQPGHGLPVQGATVFLTIKHNGVAGKFVILCITSSDETLCANRE